MPQKLDEAVLFFVWARQSSIDDCIAKIDQIEFALADLKLERSDILFS